MARMRRRDFIAVAGGTIGDLRSGFWSGAQQGGELYGLIGKMTTVPGKRDELLAILLEGIGSMPGCLSYIVAKDPSDADGIWITEVWDSETSHKASLSIPAVKETIAKGRPLVAGFSNHVATTPVGGHGLAGAKAR